MEATTWTSTDRWIDTEVVVDIYNGILLNHKSNKQVSGSEVDAPRVCFTEWSKSEREQKVLCINTFIWNLENGTDESIYRVKIETHGEKRRGHSKGWKERDKLRVAMTYMHYHVYKRELVGRCSTTERAQTAVLWPPGGLRWGWCEGCSWRGYMS